MAICKSIWAVTWVNFQRWKYDRRIWIIFVFIGGLLVQELIGFTQYGLDSGEKCSVFLLPLLFAAPGISIASMKMLLYLGILFLLCDAPFLYPNTPYMVLRSRRNCWWMGECLYILITAFLYICFITLVSMIVILPVATFGEAWGGVARAMTYGTNEMMAGELAALYGTYLDFPQKTLSYLLPAGTQMYTFLTAWASFFFLGLLQYVVTLISKSTFLGFVCAGFFVLLDPIMRSTSPYKIFRYGQYLSPVSWTSTDNLKMVDQYNYLTIPFIVVMFAILIAVLLIVIWKLSQKVMIQTRKDE